MHHVLFCNSDKNLTDKTFRCESYISDEDLTEDPEALINMDKCFLTRRSKSLVEKKSSDKQMEEVKAILKTLSNEQKKEAREKEYNDRVAFLQSGRIEDRVMRVYEEKRDSRSMFCKESEINSASDGRKQTICHL